MIPTKRALAILKTLGAKDAPTWAKAHAEFPAIQRWLFLTGLWRMVRGDDQPWAEGTVVNAANRILASGADPRDVHELVRETQIDLLYEVCQLIDDPSHGIEDLQGKVAENVEWRLCEYDGEKEQVGRAMQDVHASFHRFDPTGRGGEPPPRDAKKAATKARRGKR